MARAALPLVLLAECLAASFVACQRTPMRDTTSTPAPPLHAAAPIPASTAPPTVDREAQTVRALDRWARRSFAITWDEHADGAGVALRASLLNGSAAAIFCGPRGALDRPERFAPQRIDPGATRAFSSRGPASIAREPRGLYCLLSLRDVSDDPGEISTVLDTSGEEMIVLAAYAPTTGTTDYAFAGREAHVVAWDNGRVIHRGDERAPTGAPASRPAR